MACSQTLEGIPLEEMHCTCRLYTAVVREETVLERRLVTDRVHTSSTEIHRSPVCRFWASFISCSFMSCYFMSCIFMSCHSVRHFHVLQFHALYTDPSISCRAISCAANWSVNFTSVIFTASIFSAPNSDWSFGWGLRTPNLREEEAVGGRGWYHWKERWWVSV